MGEKLCRQGFKGEEEGERERDEVDTGLSRGLDAGDRLPVDFKTWVLPGALQFAFHGVLTEVLWGPYVEGRQTA